MNLNLLVNFHSVFIYLCDYLVARFCMLSISLVIQQLIYICSNLIYAIKNKILILLRLSFFLLFPTKQYIFYLKHVYAIFSVYTIPFNF